MQQNMVSKIQPSYNEKNKKEKLGRLELVDCPLILVRLAGIKLIQVSVLYRKIVLKSSQHN